MDDKTAMLHLAMIFCQLICGHKMHICFIIRKIMWHRFYLLFYSLFILLVSFNVTHSFMSLSGIGVSALTCSCFIEFCLDWHCILNCIFTPLTLRTASE